MKRISLTYFGNGEYQLTGFGVRLGIPEKYAPAIVDAIEKIVYSVEEETTTKATEKEYDSGYFDGRRDAIEEMKEKTETQIADLKGQISGRLDRFASALRTSLEGGDS